MNKISLSSIPFNTNARVEFLELLETAILNSPISEKTRKILTVLLPSESKNMDQKSLLVHVLDRGVITTGIKPTDWSNSGDFWNWGKEYKALHALKIRPVDIRKAFDDVNQYLDGFSFSLHTENNRWLIGYNSQTFEASMKTLSDQMERV